MGNINTKPNQDTYESENLYSEPEPETRPGYELEEKMKGRALGLFYLFVVLLCVLFWSKALDWFLS